jgi:hypothetical protein
MKSWGIEPSAGDGSQRRSNTWQFALPGCSVLEDGLKLIAYQVVQLQALPPNGKMVAVTT